MNFLIDYNLTGDAVLFWGTLVTKLSESVFANIWDHPEDAEYNYL